MPKKNKKSRLSIFFSRLTEPAVSSGNLLGEELTELGESPRVISYRTATKELIIIGSATIPLQLMKAAVSVINSVMLSNVGKDERNALMLVNAFMSFVCNPLNGPLGYVQTIIGELNTDEKRGEIGSAAQASWTLAIILSVPQAGLLAISKPILIGCQQNPQTAELAQRFFNIFAASVPLASLQTASEQITLGTKRIYFPVVMQGASLIGFSLLAYPLIFGAWGMPKLGILGSAYAYLGKGAIYTLLSFGGLAACGGMDKMFSPFGLFKWKEQDFKKNLLRLFSKSAPLPLMILSEVGVQFVLNLLAGASGKDTLSVQLVISQYQEIILIFTIACGTAVQNRIATSLRNHKRDVIKYGNTGIFLSLVAPTIFAVFTICAPKLLMRAFINPDDPAEKDLVRVLDIALPISAINNVLLAIRSIAAQALVGTKRLDTAWLANMSTVWIGVAIAAGLVFGTDWDPAISLNLGLMCGFAVSALGQTINWYNKGTYKALVARQEELFPTGIPTLSEELTTWLEVNEINRDHFLHIVDNPQKFEDLFFSSKWRRAWRWLVYDETLQKMIWWWMFKEQCILGARLTVFRSSFSRNRASMTVPLLDFVAPVRNEKKITRATKHKGCAPRIWPQANHFQFAAKSLLQEIYAEVGFMNGTTSLVMKVWTILLSSFVFVDAYNFYAYPESRFGNTLWDVIAGQTNNEQQLSRSLLSPAVWPELVIVPILWGLLRGGINMLRLSQMTSQYLDDLCEELRNYQPSFWRDGILPLLWPFTQTQRQLSQLSLTLLWNGRLEQEDFEKAFETLLDLSTKSRFLRQLKILSVLAELADGANAKDLGRLHQAGIEPERILSLLKYKLQAFELLIRFANGQVDVISSSKSSMATYETNGWMSSLYAHYLLWCLGQPQKNSLSLLFWLYKLGIFYLKGRLFWLLGQGVKLMIDDYLAKLACKKEGKLWLYMERFRKSECTTCGNLKIAYPYVFDIENCATYYFNLPRKEEEIIAFFEIPSTQQLKTLSLSQQDLPSTSFTNVLNELYKKAPNLEVLLLNKTASTPRTDILSATANAALGKIFTLPALRYIDLSFQNLGPESAAAIGKALEKSSIKALYLNGNHIGAEGAKFLTLNSRLEILSLDGNGIGDTGLKYLIPSSPQLPMQYLSLATNGIGPNGMEFLASLLSRVRIRNLNLGYNNLGVNGSISLAAILRNNTGIQIISLRFNNMEVEGIKAIAAVLPQAGILSMDLRGNNLGDDGLRFLSNALSNGAKVQNLHLAQNGFSAAGIKFLADALPWSQVKVLYIYTNNIGDEGAGYLAAAFPQSLLQDLDIGNSNLGIQGIRWIIDALLKSQIQYLSLWQSHIGNETMQFIAASLPQAKIHTLFLGGNNLGNDGAKYAAALLSQSKTLKSLDLGMNGISDQGAEFLAAASTQSPLQYLEIYDNLLGDKGAVAFASALSKFKSPLQYFDLGGNGIGDIGAKALAEVLVYQPRKQGLLWINTLDPDTKTELAYAAPNTNLKALGLRDNALHDDGAKAICQALPSAGIAFTHSVYFFNQGIRTTSMLYGNPVNNTALRDECYVTSGAIPNAPLWTRMLLRSYRLTMSYIRGLIKTNLMDTHPQLSSIETRDRVALSTITVTASSADVAISDIFSAQTSAASTYRPALPFNPAHSSLTLFGQTPLALATAAIPTLPASASTSTANLSPFLFLLGGVASGLIAVFGSTAKPISSVTHFIGSFFSRDLEKPLAEDLATAISYHTIVQ